MIKFQEQNDRFEMRNQKNLEICTVENNKKNFVLKEGFYSSGNPSPLWVNSIVIRKRFFKRK